MKKFSEWAMALLFSGTLLVLMAATILLPKERYSYYENRNLSAFPEISVESVASGKVFGELETMFCDYAAWRTAALRAVTWCDLNLFHRPVVNEVVVTPDALLEELYTMPDTAEDILREADAVAALAILNTVTASAAGMVSWLAVERVHTGRPTLVGASTGLVAGLVVVTPGAGFVEPWAALVMGLIVSPVCYLAISHLKTKFGYDDALDAFGCHGIGGILGGVLTGLFCVPELSWTGKGGLFYTGDVSLLVSQVLGIVVTVVIVLMLDLVIAAVVKALFHGSLRVDEADEALGLDASQHGESAYPSFSGLD